VSGVVRFTANAENPGGMAEGSMLWTVDGVRKGGTDCLNDDSCSSDFAVDAAQFPGTHTIQAVYRPNDAPAVESRVLTYHFHPVTNVAGVGASQAQANATKWTVLVYIYHLGRPAPGVPVTVTVTPAVGKPTIHTASTQPDGSVSFDYPLKYNTKISVAAGSDDGWARSTRSTTVKYTPTWTCTLAHATVKHGHPDTISCKVPSLPAGTKVDVAYLVQKQWVTLNKGHSAAGKVSLTFTPTKKGKTYVRAESKGAHVVQDANGYLPAKVT
jgi:hypothetical protein